MNKTDHMKNNSMNKTDEIDSSASLETMPILKADGLVRTYRRGERETKALDHVSLTLMAGSILGIVGESGSGKSTLIRHIACLEKADEGRLFYRGSEYTGSSPAFTGQYMQMIFQDAYGSFDPRMPFGRSLREARWMGEDTALLHELLQKVKLDESFLSRYPRSVSGGQCQRLSIVRAVYSGAHILLCDEATSALDVASQAMVIELLNKLKSEYGISMIFVSHDLGVVSQLCDRVMVMKSGRCVEEGDCLEVVTHPKDPYTRELLDAVMEVGSEAGIHSPEKEDPALMHVHSAGVM